MKTPVNSKLPYLFLTLSALLLAGCYCRNNDCPASDEILSFRIIDERGEEYDSLGNKIPVGYSGNYADSIEFYFFDEDQQKIAPTIYQLHHYTPTSPMAYYVILENLQPAAQHRYYLQYNGKTSTIDVFTHIVNDRCCGELVRFKGTSR